MSTWTLPAPADDAPARRNLVAISSPARPRGRPARTPSAARRPTTGPSPVVAAAGDIACDPASRDVHGGKGAAVACHMGATARLLGRLDPQVVLTLGDNQYENGTLAKFRRSYDRSWGRLKGRTRPAPGNTTTGPVVPPATSTTSALGPAAAPGATTALTWAPGI